MPSYLHDIVERFWESVEKSTTDDGCWLWKYQRFVGSGYGIFYLNGKPKLAHRIAYELQYGAIPQSLYVLHKPPCINRHCMRHLYVGTQKQNLADTVAMGRTAKGDRNGSRIHPEKLLHGEEWRRAHQEFIPCGEQVVTAKLTEEIVRSVRLEYIGRKGQIKEMADRYGVADTTIGAIIHRRSWKHL